MKQHIKVDTKAENNINNWKCHGNGKKKQKENDKSGWNEYIAFSISVRNWPEILLLFF